MPQFQPTIRAFGRFFMPVAFFVFGLAVAGFGGTHSGVRAQAPADVRRPETGQATRPLPTEVLVILARSEPGAMAPQLQEIEALRKPPFNAFKSMEVLRKVELAPQPGKDATLDLPNGRKLKIAILERQPGGKYKVRLAINKPDAQDYLPGMVVVASPGEPFFIAGQKHAGGTLVIGVQVGARGMRR